MGDREEIRAKVRELAAPYGLADAPWNLWDSYPAQHQRVVIVGQWVHNKPEVEAAQYDGVNFFGPAGGRHNQQTWAWIDALDAWKIRRALEAVPLDLPGLLSSFRPPRILSDLPADWFEDHDGQRLVLKERRVKALVDSVRYVVEAFERDEADGYRSRDRQFAIEILRKAMPAKQKSLTQQSHDSLTVAEKNRCERP